MQRSVIDESSPRAPCRPSAVAALSRTMKKSLGALLVVVVILAVIVLERTFTFHSRQPQTAPVAVEPLDTGALAQRLAGALRFKTISYQDSSQFDAREFDGFQRYLRTTFPKLHAALKLEKVNGYGLLYEWPGSDPSVPPIVLLAHQDVVPVEPGTETRWTEPPFEGRIAGGYVWGRGALDDKGSLVGLCEAVEHLLGAGAKPRRTLYLAFGYDEEVGGRRGAARIAELLASRNVQPEFVLDEGGALTNGLIAGVSAPVAVVGIAEKGYVTVGLTAQAEGDIPRCRRTRPRWASSPPQSCGSSTTRCRGPSAGPPPPCSTTWVPRCRSARGSSSRTGGCSEDSSRGSSARRPRGTRCSARPPHPRCCKRGSKRTCYRRRRVRS